MRRVARPRSETTSILRCFRGCSDTTFRRVDQLAGTRALPSSSVPALTPARKCGCSRPKPRHRGERELCSRVALRVLMSRRTIPWVESPSSGQISHDCTRNAGAEKVGGSKRLVGRQKQPASSTLTESRGGIHLGAAMRIRGVLRVLCGGGAAWFTCCKGGASSGIIGSSTHRNGRRQEQ